jgi:hypothetical protein
MGWLQPWTALLVAVSRAILRRGATGMQTSDQPGSDATPTAAQHRMCQNGAINVASITAVAAAGAFQPAAQCTLPEHENRLWRNCIFITHP